METIKRIAEKYGGTLREDGLFAPEFLFDRQRPAECFFDEATGAGAELVLDHPVEGGKTRVRVRRLP